MIFKRLFDICLAVFLLIILFPLLVLIGLLNLVFMGRPVLFNQLRPGLKGKPFQIYKFRTMSNVVNSDASSGSDAERLTAYGKFLRATSLDELPELWNIIRGDMSFVGPRPLMMEYLPRYSTRQARRHEVLPGLTGWAQINGRNAISWEEKFELDLWYAENHSRALDLRILAVTAWKVLSRHGINASGETPMPEFRGSSIL